MPDESVCKTRSSPPRQPPRSSNLRSPARSIAGSLTSASHDGGRILWVAATVRVMGLNAGAKIVVSGHEERSARRIVTHLTVE